MEISDIKRWQWILIGIIAGLGLGWVWSGMDPGDTSGRQVSQVDFENDLLRQYQNQPLIKDIVIQPTTTDYSNKQVQPVSFRHLKIGQNSKKVYYVPPNTWRACRTNRCVAVAVAVRHRRRTSRSRII